MPLILIKKVYNYCLDLIAKEKWGNIKRIFFDISLKRRNKNMQYRVSTSKQLINALFIRFICFYFILNQIRSTWLMRSCKYFFKKLHFKHVVTELDMIFYFACEFTLFILALRLLKMKKEENYAVKNALILYINFITSEKFHADISILFNVFCISYRTTILSTLCLKRYKSMYNLFNTLFETSVVSIYILMFFPNVLGFFMDV
ncbi:hypothetical protein EHP00_1405 [Ecytonucleospora hepatopenaei]|uniref:Uncharacterized protein n=1 Tax=Ecytonucleospora hepatopenaei TaxID=646526 RepID=A0A1W0E6F2_9MICR|nr:hypothetical protein EHP00_1405 [Ecytonucleospora hepatopenaei]